MRTLSGIQATGDITIGNYLGALKQWVKLQDQYEENFYFIPDLHTLTVRPDPKLLGQAILSTAAWLVACGIDPSKSVIYIQSQIPEHSELCWILNNFVTMGELSRMTQFKEKSKKHGQLVGLFVYPVLQAADILLYDPDIVPVGEDQKQHVEIARNIAERFNNAYGETFKLPESWINQTTSRIMDLNDPIKKMSKSESVDSFGVLRMLDDADTIKNKILRATTDSGQQVKAAKNKPGITNLLHIYAGLTDRNIVDIEKDYQGKLYANFKQELTDLIVATVLPIQVRYKELIKASDELLSVLQQGRQKAQSLAEQKLRKVKQKLGLFLP